MSQLATIVHALQDQVRNAVQTKIPKDYHEYARSLYPDLGKVIHSAVAHYQPPSPEALLDKLRGNETHQVKLLVELLTEKTPLFFMDELERKLVLRKKTMLKVRYERRSDIEQAFKRTVKRVVDKVKDFKPSSGSVILIDYLVQTIHVPQVDSLKPIFDTPFWEIPENQQALKSEIDHHLYYFVVKLLDALQSYALPDEFKVRPQDLDFIRVSVIFVLQEIFSTTFERVQAGKFVSRNTHYGNRGDRSMDNEMFLTRKRRKGLTGFIGEIKEIYR